MGFSTGACWRPVRNLGLLRIHLSVRRSACKLRKACFSRFNASTCSEVSRSTQESLNHVLFTSLETQRNPSFLLRKPLSQTRAVSTCPTTSNKGIHKSPGEPAGEEASLGGPKAGTRGESSGLWLWAYSVIEVGFSQGSRGHDETSVERILSSFGPFGLVWICQFGLKGLGLV